MIGSCNCPTTGVRLQPTVQLHCAITALQINKRKKKTADNATITSKEIIIVMINIFI